jgi:hypothetical protein
MNRYRYLLSKSPWIYSTRALYFMRNYLVDGVLPMALVVIAFASLFQIVDVHWIRAIAPPDRNP